jgi:hypothetical protein
MTDAYAVARYVRHYRAKNGYSPRVGELPDSGPADIELLVKNGIIELLPLYEGGSPIGVMLTVKGLRMATETRRRR